MLGTEPPERDLFLLDEVNEKTAPELIKGIININIWDAEQERKIVGYKRDPIRIHICTPRRNARLWFCYMRPN